MGGAAAPGSAAPPLLPREEREKSRSSSLVSCRACAWGSSKCEPTWTFGTWGVPAQGKLLRKSREFISARRARTRVPLFPQREERVREEGHFVGGLAGLAINCVGSGGANR